MKKVIRVLLFVFVLSAAFGFTYRALSLKDTMGLAGSSIRQLDDTKKDSIDVVFLGSSHVYHGISPAALWRNYGIAAFDMAISSMDKQSSYYHLKYLLKKQSPEYIFIDLYPMLFERQQVIGNVYRNLLGLPYSVESFQLVNAYAEKEERTDYITKFPIIHTRYAELTKDDFYDFGFAKYGRGERPDTTGGGNASFDVAYSCEDVTPISDENLEWLDKISALAQNAGSEVIFYVTPYATDVRAQSIFNAVYDYALNHDVGYLDLSKMAFELGLDGNRDYQDPEHMNTYGATKVSNWLGAWISETGRVKDHRGDPDYIYWDFDAAYTDHYLMMADFIKSIAMGDSFATLEFLKQIPDVTYVVSLEGTWEDSTLPICDYLEVLNINADEAINGGVWIGSMGNNTFIMDNTSKDTYIQKLSATSQLKVERTKGDTLENIKIDYENAQYVYNGLSVVLFDHADGKVVKVLGIY